MQGKAAERNFDWGCWGTVFLKPAEPQTLS